MNIDTGEILDLEEVRKKEIKEQEKFIEIPYDLQEGLKRMNRKQRRKYYQENKKEFKSAGIFNPSEVRPF